MNHSVTESDPWGKAILIGGGGCLGLLLMLGVALTLGSVEATEGCCNRLEQAQRDAALPAQEFLDATGRGDLPGALAQMSEDYRQEHDVEAFRTFLDSHGTLLIGGQARVLGMRVVGDTSQLTVQIIEPRTGTIKGVATFSMIRDRRDRSRKTIARIDKDKPPGIETLEDKADTFLRRHVQYLARGAYDQAHAQVDPSFTDRTTFEMFARGEEALFAQGATVTLLNLEGDATLPGAVKATIAIKDEGKDTLRGHVTYTLRVAPGNELSIIRIETQQDAP